jgi:hypothetical protein
MVAADGAMPVLKELAIFQRQAAAIAGAIAHLDAVQPGIISETSVCHGEVLVKTKRSRK